SPFSSPDTAMDGLHRIRSAEHRANLTSKIVKSVTMLGENDQFTRFLGTRIDEVVVLQDLAEFDPLAISVKITDSLSEMNELVEVGQLDVEFFDRARRSGA